MKNLFYAMAIAAGVAGFSSCSNGDYTASPSSNVNSAVNPITPLTSSQFTWTGEEPLSADINGVHFKADSASFYLVDTTGTNIIYAAKGKKAFYFSLKDSWGGNVYSLAYMKGGNSRFSYYTDSASFTGGYYFSASDNSGGIMIVQNDSAVIKGLFYYKGLSGTGEEVNISNGYFKIKKF